MPKQIKRNANSTKRVKMSASAARAEGAQRTQRALDAARGEALRAIAAKGEGAAKKPDKPSQGATVAKAASPTPAPRRTSALDAAAQVLATSKEPMRAGDLIKRMADEGLWTSPGGKTPEATLYAAMIREIGKKGPQARFRRTDRGLFTAAA